MRPPPWSWGYHSVGMQAQAHPVRQLLTVGSHFIFIFIFQFVGQPPFLSFDSPLTPGRGLLLSRSLACIQVDIQPVRCVPSGCTESLRLGLNTPSSELSCLHLFERGKFRPVQGPEGRLWYFVTPWARSRHGFDVVNGPELGLVGTTAWFFR